MWTRNVAMQFCNVLTQTPIFASRMFKKKNPPKVFALILEEHIRFDSPSCYHV